MVRNPPSFPSVAFGLAVASTAPPSCARNRSTFAMLFPKANGTSHARKGGTLARVPRTGTTRGPFAVGAFR